MQRELKQLLLAASTAWFFWIDVFIFERREIDQKKNIDHPCIKPVSWQNKLESAPYSPALMKEQ